MKFFVTGVGGQLGHDVMNELLKRGHEGVGSDIQENYSGVADGSAVTKAPYVALDITDKDAVEKILSKAFLLEKGNKAVPYVLPRQPTWIRHNLQVVLQGSDDHQETGI